MWKRPRKSILATAMFNFFEALKGTPAARRDGLSPSPVLTVARSPFRFLDPSVLTLAPQSVSVISLQRPLLSSPAQHQSIEFIDIRRPDNHQTCTTRFTSSCAIQISDLGHVTSLIARPIRSPNRRVIDSGRSTSVDRIFASRHLSTQHANDDILPDSFHFG